MTDLTTHRRGLRRAVLALGLGLAVAGCTGTDANVQRLKQDVIKISVGEPHPISANTLASAMLQAGFSPEEVLEYGPAVRNAIGVTGGAQINDGKYADAILSVQDGNLYVSSRDGGTFIRDL